jgi:TolB-like protein/Flp pilus assembly protein TadD
MKRCPQCNATYTDETLNFCLEDGEWLLKDDEAATAILRDGSASEAPTRYIDPHTTAPTEPHFAHNPTIGASGRRGKMFWILGGLAVAIILASVIGFFYFNSSNAKQIESVAVLPFENNTGDPNLDYLSDGISETLIDKLAQLPQLKVIARNSSFKYRGANTDLQDVATRLGVRAIVTGKVSRVADNLNVHVEMVDLAENRQLWSEHYSRNVSDLLLIQQEIAATASEKLRLRLSGNQEQQLSKRDTVNPTAYELLLKGRHVFAKSGSENVKRSIDYFEQAVAADPEYALAHAELSLKYYVLTGYSLADPKVYIPKAEAAANRALELDKNLAEAHLAKSRINVARWQWSEGEAERRRAVELEPNNAAAHDLYAQLLVLLGRSDEAIAEARRAKELDPVSPVVASNFAFRLYFARRHDESIAELKRILESDPDLDYVYNFLGYNYFAKGQFQESVAAYEEAVRLGDTSTSIQNYLGAAYARAGKKEKAKAIFTHLQTTREYVSQAELAALLIALDDKEGAFAALERAFAEHDLQMQFLKADPAYDPLRDDPRFTDLMRRVGLQT